MCSLTRIHLRCMSRFAALPLRCPLAAPSLFLLFPFASPSLPNHRRFRGHNLCWGNYNPNWLTKLDAAGKRSALINHVTAVVKVRRWR
jgi:hypothetical protein